MGNFFTVRLPKAPISIAILGIAENCNRSVSLFFMLFEKVSFQNYEILCIDFFSKFEQSVIECDVFGGQCFFVFFGHEQVLHFILFIQNPACPRVNFNRVLTDFLALIPKIMSTGQHQIPRDEHSRTPPYLSLFPPNNCHYVPMQFLSYLRFINLIEKLRADPQLVIVTLNFLRCSAYPHLFFILIFLYSLL